MSDSEFDLLDELYFVRHFDYLKDSLGWPEELLLETLHSLYQAGMIKCLSQPDLERFDAVDIFSEGNQLMYLATKKGLMSHNAL